MFLQVENSIILGFANRWSKISYLIWLEQKQGDFKDFLQSLLYFWFNFLYFSFFLIAFGVAHQGVEKLLPENETVLIQGMHFPFD